MIALLVASSASAQGPENVLVVVNRNSAVSQRIGDYYMHRRAVPPANLCRLTVTPNEEINREIYDRDIEQPIREFLRTRKLAEQILYIVTTLGVPLKIAGEADQQRTTGASVDSELTTLYQKLHGAKPALPGPLPNPMFGKLTMPFKHPAVPVYMVTRLAGYDYADVAAMIDRSLAALDRGKVVIDLRADESDAGNTWLRAAAKTVARDRLIMDESGKVLHGQKDVIAYASWGSNDSDRHRRLLGFEWLPGAVMTDFVSTNGRTFVKPLASWTLGAWKDPRTWFAGSPQTLCADEIHEGVSGASGHVYEPFLAFTPRPDALIPAYLGGRNLADSYYVAIRSLSWQNIVLGDPLCRLKKAQ